MHPIAQGSVRRVETASSRLRDVDQSEHGGPEVG
jgi:hypothetical protein